MLPLQLYAKVWIATAWVKGNYVDAFWVHNDVHRKITMTYSKVPYYIVTALVPTQK